MSLVARDGKNNLSPFDGHSLMGGGGEGGKRIIWEK